MSRYRKVHVKMWGDAKFKSISAPEPSGQMLWIYLLTGPHTGPIPGIFSAGEAALAEALDWELEAFREAFQEVYRKAMVKADWKARFVFIPKALYYNEPESPNVVKSWRNAFDELPECELKHIAFAHVKAFLKGFKEAFRKPFDKPLLMPLPNQEQEHEQEQDIGASPPKNATDPPHQKRKSTEAPKEFLVTPELMEWAKVNVPGINLGKETAAFLDHHQSKGNKFRDWTAAWRKWMRNAAEWGKARNNDQGGSAIGKPADWDRLRREEEARRREYESGKLAAEHL